MPTESTTALSAVFDQQLETRPARRRRAAPDWGGDDLFDHVPRRRFVRGDDGLHHGQDRPAHQDDVDRLADHARRPAAGHVEAGPPRSRPRPVQELVLAREAEYAPTGPTTAAVEGRRTVTVTGRPGPAFAPRTSGPARHRPRTMEERIGGRPDQIAGWAFALGILLILIAVLV